MITLIRVKSILSKSFILFLSIFSLSACLLTDEFKQDLVESYEENSQVERLARLEQKVEEWNQIRPQLAKLIELEGDLEYLAEVMVQNDRTNNKQSIMPAVGALQEDVNALLDDISTQNNDVFVPAELRVIGETMQAPNYQTTASFDKTQSSVEVMAVKPINSNMRIDSNEDAATDSKFSGGAVSNSSSLANTANKYQAPMMDSVAQNGVDDDKFSQSVSSSVITKQSRVNDCSNPSLSNGELSVHIASYSSSTRAKQGLQEIINKHKNTLCNLKPILANVNVNGKNYYSLRFGPLSTLDEVNNVCVDIRAGGDYCARAEYSGDSL